MKKNKNVKTFPFFINSTLRLCALIGFLSLLLSEGFHPGKVVQTYNQILQWLLLIIFAILNSVRILFLDKKEKLWILNLIALIIVLFFNPLTGLLPQHLHHPFWYRELPLWLFIIAELSVYSITFLSIQLNPALLYVLSFLFLIALATLLLSLPVATYKPLSFIDALFTATSASCVTGLIVHDTANTFTFIGQVFLLIIIQLGGLGVITFTYLFGYFLQGGTTLQSQIHMQQLLSADNVSTLVKTLKQIIFITLSVEAIGAILIFFTTADSLSHFTLGQRWWFAVFHAVSAFCNAGFSIIEDGLYHPLLRHNAPFQIIIALLIIIGGIGFYAIFSFIHWLYVRGFLRLRAWVMAERFFHQPNIIRLNARLAVATTVILLTSSWLLFLLIEFWDVKNGKITFQGLVTAFFAAVTPRTAGFNTVDLTQLSTPAVLLTLFLMWIGASPGSTGGGIKTTTLAVAFLNIFSIARKKPRIEWNYREIPAETVRKAFAIITMSLLLIGISSLALTLSNPHLTTQQILFEVVSATSTVGLTLNTTSQLTNTGKIIIILCMFIGRVGLLTFTAAFLKPVATLRYRYPKENILVG